MGRSFIIRLLFGIMLGFGASAVRTIAIYGPMGGMKYVLRGAFLVAVERAIESIGKSRSPYKGEHIIDVFPYPNNPQVDTFARLSINPCSTEALTCLEVYDGLNEAWEMVRDSSLILGHGAARSCMEGVVDLFMVEYWSPSTESAQSLSTDLQTISLSTRCASSVMLSGVTYDPQSRLESGSSLTSTDKKFKLTMHHDCDLVLYNPRQLVWASGTKGMGVQCYLWLKMNGDVAIASGNKRSKMMVWLLGFHCRNCIMTSKLIVHEEIQLYCKELLVFNTL